MRKTWLQIGALGIFLLTGIGASADEVNKAVNKVENAAACVGHATSDAWLTARTKLALFADNRLSGGQISVETKDGTITLRGKVDSENAKLAADEIAGKIDGKKGFVDELHVIPPVHLPVVAVLDDA